MSAIDSILKNLPEMYNKTIASSGTAFYSPRQYRYNIYPSATNSHLVQLMGAVADSHDGLITAINASKDETILGTQAVAIDTISDLYTGGTTIDEIALPGYYFQVAQETVDTGSTLEQPRNKTNKFTVIIRNVGHENIVLTYNTAYPTVDTVTIGRFENAIFQFIPDSINPYTTNGVYQYLPDMPLPFSSLPVNGADDPYLDKVGQSFGFPRFLINSSEAIENNYDYKNRVKYLVSGNKTTPPGITHAIKQLLQIPGILGPETIGFYEWFNSYLPSSWSNLQTDLAGYTLETFIIDGRPEIAGPYGGLDLTAPEGQPNFFYITMPKGNLTNSGVYAEWTFTNIKTAGIPDSYGITVTPDPAATTYPGYGGYFNDVDTTFLEVVAFDRLVRLINLTRAAGTCCVLILTS